MQSATVNEYLHDATPVKLVNLDSNTVHNITMNINYYY